MDVVIKNMLEKLVIIIILLVPTYLVKLNFFGIPTNVLEILVLMIFALFLIKNKQNFSIFFKNNKVVIYSVFVILTGLIISTLTNDNLRVGFGIIKGWFLIPLMFAWVVHLDLKKRKNPESIIKWLYIGISGVAIISLIQYLTGDLTYDGRLSGIYNSPNFLAMYLSPGALIGLWLVWKKKTHTFGGKIINIAYLLSLLVILTALYLTYSYAAWLAVLTSATIAYFLQNQKINRRAVLTIAVIILLIFISQQESEKSANLKDFTHSSLESRIIIWKSALKILKDNWFLGIGPGNFQSKYLEYQKFFPPYLEWAVPQPHNLYLAFWLQAGIAGLIGFLMLIFYWLKSLIKTLKNDQLALVLFAIVSYILIHGFFDTSYWKNDLAIVFWVIIVLGLKNNRSNNYFENSNKTNYNSIA